MTKLLVILFLLMVLAAIIAVRYRKQIQMAIYMFRMVRKMRQMGKTEEKQIETKEVSSNSPLVKCSGCGNWISESQALNMRSKNFYCSADCVQKAVKVN